MNYQENPEIFNGPVYKTLTKLTLPMMAGMLFDLSYNLINTWFLSMIDHHSTAIISGVGLVFPIVFLIIAIANGLFTGISSYVAVAVGKRDYHEIAGATTSGSVLSLALSVVSMILLFAFYSPLVDALAGNGVSDEAVAYGKEYLIWIIPCTLWGLIAHALLGVLQGEGKSKAIGISMVISTLTNIALDPILIFGLDMGVRGAALASNIAMLVSLGYTLLIFARQEHPMSAYFNRKSLHFHYMRDVIKQGAPQAMGMLVMGLSFMVYNWFVGNVNEHALNAFTLVGRLDMVLITPILAFSIGISTMVGQNYGRNQLERVREIYLKGITLTLGVVGTLSLVYMILAPLIFGSLTEVPEVYTTATHQVWYISLIIGLTSVVEIASSFAFQAIKRPFVSLLVTLMRLGLFSMPILIVLTQFLGHKMEYVWIALAVGNVAGATISYFWFRRTIGQLIWKQSA